MIGYFSGVLNFNRLVLKLNRFYFYGGPQQFSRAYANPPNPHDED